GGGVRRAVEEQAAAGDAARTDCHLLPRRCGDGRRNARAAARRPASDPLAPPSHLPRIFSAFSHRRSGSRSPLFATSMMSLATLVDTLAPDRSDQPFRDAVLPRRARRNGLVTDTHGS